MKEIRKSPKITIMCILTICVLLIRFDTSSCSAAVRLSNTSITIMTHESVVLRVVGSKKSRNGFRLIKVLPE